MKKGILSVCLFVVLAIGFVVNPSQARTAYSTISRGEEKGWFINPGDKLVVYYVPDGRPCTVLWKNNWFYWWSNDSFSTINIYASSGYNKTKYWVYGDSLAPYYRKLSLSLSNTKALYSFEIKNYRGGEIAYLKIQ